MNTLPLWLQITGIVVGVVTGIIGTVLGILNVVWRRQEAEPDLTVSWEEERYADDTRRAWIVVRNKGHVAVPITDVFFRLTEPSEGEIISRAGLIGVGGELPFRLEPRDRKLIDLTPPFLYALLKPAIYDVVATVVDGLGNHYEAEAFLLNNLSDPSSDTRLPDPINPTVDPLWPDPSDPSPQERGGQGEEREPG